MEGQQPRISIVMIGYNAERFWAEGIASVQGQSFTDWELLMVNDASTDGTKNLLDSFADEKRYRAFHHAQNQGAAAARNTGMKNARGEYIAFFDCDDLWLQDFLAETIAYLDTHPETAGVFCGVEKTDVDTGKVLGHLLPVEGDALKQLLYHVPSVVTQTSAVLFRSSILDTIGLMDESLIFTEDWEFWIRMVKHFRVDGIPQVMVKYRVHPFGGSHKIERNRKYSFISIEKLRQAGYFESEAFFRTCLARLHMIYAGSFYHHSNRKLPILYHLWKALLTDPQEVLKKVRQFVGGQ